MFIMKFVLALLIVITAEAGGPVAPPSCSNCKTNNNFGTTTDCPTFKAYLECLDTHADLPCTQSTGDASTAATSTLCDADPSVTGTACKCQETFWSSARTDDATRCTGYKEALGCLAVAKGTTCGSVAVHTFAGTVDTWRLGLTTCSVPTATCLCEIAAAKTDGSTDALMCTRATTQLACLTAITTTTEIGCMSGSTQAALVTSVTATKTAKCTTGGGSGSAADHCTFTTASIVLALMSTFFL